ncbi:MAG: hypothetical protein GXO39_00910 [Thermotogae bacterium]|nr:hypothetical protein [Thermotogota bacterium]
MIKRVALLILLSVGCSDVDVQKGVRYDAQLMKVPQIPGSETVGRIVSRSAKNELITYVLRTKSPYDSVVSFYLKSVKGMDSAAAGQIYTITSGTELMIQIKEEGSYREITVTRSFLRK